MRRIAARYLYTLADEKPLENAFVETEDDGTVIRTGLCGDLSGEREYYGGAVVPGFVNAHCHVELSYMKGLFRRGSGMAGFIDQINSLRNTVSREERTEEIRRWMALLWDRGVSAMVDISNCNDSFAVKAESPMYTRTFLEVFGTEPEGCASVMEEAYRLQEEAESLGLDAAPAPHACYTMSPELLSASCAAGLRSGYLSYHSEETPEEEEMIASGRGPLWENRRRAGMSTPPVTGKSSLLYFLDRLKEVHAAPFKEHILLVHEVCMDREGAEAVRNAMLNPFIALCPLSNIFIHEMLPPVDMLRRSGLKLTVGTDSLSSNDDLDMVKELLCLQENFPGLGLGEMLVWSCRNGAEFLSRDELGSIAPGKRPGLVHVDGLDGSGKLTVVSKSHRII